MQNRELRIDEAHVSHLKSFLKGLTAMREESEEQGASYRLDDLIKILPSFTMMLLSWVQRHGKGDSSFYMELCLTELYALTSVIKLNKLDGHGN